MANPEATPLTTKEKMERLISLRGLMSFSDHEDCGECDTEVLDDVIRRASNELYGYIRPTYSIANIAKSPTVCDWATTVAVFYLMKRRGNEASESIYDDYLRIMEKPDGLVHETRKGNFLLPCVPKTNYDTPTFSNLTVDRRFPVEKVRVTRENSSNLPSEVEQDRAPTRGGYDV